MDSSRRRIVLIAIAAFLVGSTLVVAASHLTGTSPVDNGVPLSAPDGMTVTIDGATYAFLENFTASNGTVDLITEDGNATFYSSGSAAATVHKDDITGTWTNVTAINTSQNNITIDPEDKDSIIVGNEIDSVAFRDSYGLDDGTIDFVYGGATGQSRVTIRGVPADTEIFAVDADTNNILDYATSTSGGEVTFDALDNSEHNVVLTTDENDAPTLSNPDPVGPQNSTVDHFEIDVNDSNFPQGDTVTAELFVEGDKKGEDTLTSNGTANVSHSVDLGKSIDYSWVATDDFGGETIENYTLTTPVNVTFREETNASQVITGVNATITMYSTDASIVVKRSDDNDDGNISLEGLPDKEFVAVAESDDHYTRRVYIQSIYEQQSIFLLNQSEVPGSQAVNTTFTFEDRTGNFDPEVTTLRVQRAVDLDNNDTYEWKTIAGDFWGAASEFPFTGEENARYRLIVENADGDRRVLGTHIPTDDGVKNIVNGEIRFDAGNATGRYFAANLSEADENIQVLYQDPTDGTGDIRVRVWKLGNQSNVIHDQNYTSSPYGRLFTTIDLTSDQAGESWVVRIDSTHDDGSDIELQTTVGGVGILLPMDPWLLAALGVISVTFAATLYGPRTATGGAWILVIAAMGLTAFGWVGFPIAGLIIAAAIAAAGTFYKEALP